jgi:CRP-like cAMP-binding protein
MDRFCSGEHGEEFFVIESGLTEVSINGNFIRELGPGKHFGELALQTHGALRSATSAKPTGVLPFLPLLLLLLLLLQFSFFFSDIDRILSFAKTGSGQNTNAGRKGDHKG